MKEELTARLEAKIEVEIKPNKEKCEVIQSTLVSQIDVHQARTGNSRRNNSPYGRLSGKDGSQCECPAKRG
jgi:hypothetical protein